MLQTLALFINLLSPLPCTRQSTCHHHHHHYHYPHSHYPYQRQLLTPLPTLTRTRPSPFPLTLTQPPTLILPHLTSTLLSTHHQPIHSSPFLSSTSFLPNTNITTFYSPSNPSLKPPYSSTLPSSSLNPTNQHDNRSPNQPSIHPISTHLFLSNSSLSSSFCSFCCCSSSARPLISAGPGDKLWFGLHQKSQSRSVRRGTGPVALCHADA